MVAIPINKLPANKDPVARAQREAEYQAQVEEVKRKRALTLARVEPLEDVDLGRSNFEASTAISLKRIADSLDQIMMELRASNMRAKS